ncbi:transposase [uncultured Sunxiuqinia sp.]|uniref:transposase n=1 Tax=uncultured Sunxiuqinia sp. TaxID=1573825 RepID=UPI0030D9F930
MIPPMGPSNCRCLMAIIASSCTTRGTGQIVVPILRPGNSHSNKWYVAILKRLLKKIRAAYPKIEIVIRAEGGFSCPAFYQLADDFNLQFTIGLATNETLKKKTARAEKAVRHLFVSNNIIALLTLLFR